jgi:uncharacterized protein YggE
MIAAAVLGGFLASASHASAQEPAASRIPSIVTTGEAVVRRAPDQAFVTIAVEIHARDPRDAQRQNADAMTAVQQKIASLGIGKDALRTLGYTVQQEVDYINGKRVPRGYVARNALEVRLDAPDRAGEIVDAAVQAGATSVGGIRFDLKDRAGAEREARRLAVADARARADAAAAGAGASIDRVLRIEEARESPPTPRPMMMTMMARSPEPAAETPIETGLIEVHAHVTLTVSIK